MNYRLLIVDDEPIVRNGLLHFDWESHGFEAVDACGNAREALKWLADGNEAHVILTDIKMPGMDGVELSNEIRMKYPDLLVVLLTGYNEFNYAQRAIQSGVFDYLLKPAEDEDFGHVLVKCAKELSERSNRGLDLDDLLNLSSVIRKIGLLASRTSGLGPRRLSDAIDDIVREFEACEFPPGRLWPLMRFLLTSLEMEFAKLPYFPEEKWTARKESFYRMLEEDRVTSFEQANEGLRRELGHFVRELNLESSRQKDSSKLDAVLAFIHERYSEVLSLDVVAESADLHPNTFSSWFKETKGMNFVDYVTKYRIDRSKELLEGTNLKAGQVAESVGIPDARYFGQVFKKHVGLTPSEYRSMFKSNLC
ncbi:two-component system, response regulator YesN [Paenibacillus sp. UNC496MF]|uniref:response regulator n=1 Tax=Paenibacillus sp. UNC496MF TaxID=1502753 RepID=UPI0008EFBB52|nr:response regulator [Paenibacillus sp. UNC496MF]SFJ82563.1 two-component system, response regulator YesN [Paenibacillus sp. UNC496MF]